MKRNTERSTSVRGGKAVLFTLAAMLLAGAAAAQSLPLPVPEVSVTTTSRAVEVVWGEIPTTDGRAISDITFSNFDSLTASRVELFGAYTIGCDYLLRIQKEPSAGFDNPSGVPPRDEIRILLKYQLWTNIDNIGAPLAEDILDLRQPDTPALFEPELVGPLGLGMSVKSNIDQPTTMLGSIPVTVSGLNTGNEAIANYMVTAEAPGSLPGALLVRVRGPFQTLPPSVLAFDSTMVVSAVDTPIKIMNGMFVTFGDGMGGGGSAAPGDTVKWSARHLFPQGSKVEANLEAFEGYHVWRSDLPNVESGFSLLGEIQQCESKFDFVLLDEGELEELDIQLDYDPFEGRFRLTDFDVHDDFPYRYAISTFDRGFLGNLESRTFEGQLATTDKIYPAFQARDPGRAAYVVPNPYKRSAAWEEGGGKVVFANLPPVCTIRIFTVAADHVTTIQHSPTQPRSTSPTSTSWDLVSDAGQSVVPGIYMFHILSSDGFEQSGKLIVAR